MMITVAYVLATLAIFLIAAGLFFASDRRRHVPLMLAAFVADIVGLLLVEFGAHAVEGVMAGKGTMWTYIHITFSVATLVLYGVQIATGRRLMRADRGILGFHKKAAKAFVLMRILAYVTMWVA